MTASNQNAEQITLKPRLAEINQGSACIGRFWHRFMKMTTPAATQKPRQPLKWEARVPDNGRVIRASVIADDLFALRFPNDTESFFLVEIDRRVDAGAPAFEC